MPTLCYSLDIEDKFFGCSAIKANKNGIIQFDFSASDIPGYYKVTIEGVSSEGHLISKTLKL